MGSESEATCQGTRAVMTEHCAKVDIASSELTPRLQIYNETFDSLPEQCSRFYADLSPRRLMKRICFTHSMVSRW